MSATYDPRWVREFYDAYGDKEWDRLVKDPENEVKLHIHRHYLEKHVRFGNCVAEIGAGAGRFTQILVEIGALVTVIDISSVQLDLNRKHAVQHGFEHGVRDRLLLDMCNLAGVESATFDAVVCYGGPLSYVFDQAGKALDEIYRILKPGGAALISVMSLWGTVHRYLDGILKLPGEVNRPIIRTGDFCPEHYPEGRHHCHMFRAPELREVLESHGLAVIEMSASNCVSTVWQERLAEARNTPAQWQQLLEMEIEACREPGCVDMGTHTIAVCRKVSHQ
jgi:SAM-dependent methyltransferase